MFDPEFTETIYVSPSYAEIWGQPVESLYEVPRSFVAVVHREDREAVIAAKQSAHLPLAVSLARLTAESVAGPGGTSSGLLTPAMAASERLPEVSHT